MASYDIGTSFMWRDKSVPNVNESVLIGNPGNGLNRNTNRECIYKSHWFFSTNKKKSSVLSLTHLVFSLRLKIKYALRVLRRWTETKREKGNNRRRWAATCTIYLHFVVLSLQRKNCPLYPTWIIAVVGACKYSTLMLMARIHFRPINNLLFFFWIALNWFTFLFIPIYIVCQYVKSRRIIEKMNLHAMKLLLCF